MLKKLLFLFALACAPAYGQGGRYDNIAFKYGPTGAQPLPGSQITVCTSAGIGSPCTPLASIFIDQALTQPASNPLTADAFGNWGFYAAPGAYVYTITGPGIVGAGPFPITVPCVPGSSCGSGGGSPGSPVNSIQKNNAGSFGASGISDNGTTISHSEDVSFKGLNPGIDIRAYGATFTPIAATTCTTTGGVAAITTAANAPANGHGIMCMNAGPATALSTPSAPTVTPSVTSGPMQTGFGQAGGTGSTTYAYKIVAEDLNGGMTAASSAGSTTTGNASLGTQTVNISSWARSNTTLTVTTSSAHGLVVSSMAEINNDTGIGNPFYCQVLTVPDNTHFTCGSNLDTRNGAAASGGSGGTVTWRNLNHLSMSNVAGVFRYWIYGNNCPTTCNLIGVTLPVITSGGGNLTNDPLNNTWDDFGFGTTNAPPHPAWVPTTAPASAKAQNLVTTIASGGGTTSPTLTVAPSTSVVTQTFQECADPAILAVDAALATNSTGGGHGEIPITTGASTSFTTCGTITLGQFNRVSAWLIKGTLNLGDTLICNECDLNGDPVNPTGSFSFDRRTLVLIKSTTAPLMLWTNFQSAIQKFSFSVPANGTAWVDDGGGSSIPGFTAEWLNFGSQSATDQLTRMWVIRNNLLGGGNEWASHLFFTPGTGTNTNAPVFIETGDGGPWFMSDWFTTKRGFFWGDGIQGESHEVYCQGCITPKFTFAGITGYGGGSGAVYFSLTNSIEDTTNSPIFNVIYTNVTGVISVNGSNGLAGYPLLLGQNNSVLFKTEGVVSSSLGPSFSGAATEHAAMPASCIDGILSTSVSTSCPQKAENLSLNVGAEYSSFVSSLPQAAPTCAVSAGGSVAVAGYTFTVAPVFAQGGEGAMSATSTTCTTSSGNQTVTINWATVTGATGYDLYENGASFQCNAPFVTPGSATSYVWSSATPCGQSAPKFAGTGPTAMTKSGLYANALTVQGGGITTAGPIVSTVAAPWIWTGPGGSCGTPPTATSTSGYSFCLGDSTNGTIDLSNNGGAWQPLVSTGPGGSSSGSSAYTFYLSSTSNCLTPSVSGSTVCAHNNQTNAIDYSGSDAAVVINNAIAANIANCGTLFFKNGTYNFNSMTLESTGGYTNLYYAVAFPANQNSTNQYCGWRIEGESSTTNGAARGIVSNGVIFNVTAAARTSCGTGHWCVAWWHRPDTTNHVGNDVRFDNVTTQFPDNQRGNEAAFLMWEAATVDYYNVNASLAVNFGPISSPNISPAVAGANHMIGLSSTMPSRNNWQRFVNTNANGYDIGYDIESEHSVLDSATAWFSNQGFYYCRTNTFGSYTAGSCFHPSVWKKVTDQEDINGIAIGSNLVQGSRLDILGYDIEFLNSGSFTRVNNVTEANNGYTSGIITYTYVLATGGVVGELPSGTLFNSGGANFEVYEGTTSPNNAKNAASDTFTRPNTGAPTIGQNVLGPQWSSNSASTTCGISSNAAITGANANTTCVVSYAAQPANNDQFSKLTVNSINANANVGVLVRASPTPGTITYYAYYCKTSIGTNQRAIWKAVAGTFTQITTTPANQTSACNNGDTIELWAVGTTLIGFYTPSGGTRVVDMIGTDSSITSGQPGIDLGDNLASSSPSATNFQGGSLANNSPAASIFTQGAVFPTYNSLSNCLAAGSSIAASAVACGSAAAGMFSIPITTPTSAVVTTTALTPYSQIFVQQRLDTTNGAGAALSVTCNTTANTTFPNVTARTATSFTITFAAFSTNPGCYEYHIIN